MVERLKVAIERARQMREGGLAATGKRPSASPMHGGPVERRQSAFDVDALRELKPAVDTLRRARVVSAAKTDPAHVAFDLLRTRLMAVCRKNGWRRVAVTSPTKGCGKSTVSLNLAFSIARQKSARTLLVDADLRAPLLAELLGVDDAPDIESFLLGNTPLESYLTRIKDNLFIGLNGRPIRDSAELIHGETASRVLDDAMRRIEPDIAIFDLPPILAGDDVIGFLPNVDCAMVILSAGDTRPQELTETERLLAGSTNFLGVVLNRSGDGSADTSYYGS